VRGSSNKSFLIITCINMKFVLSYNVRSWTLNTRYINSSFMSKAYTLGGCKNNNTNNTHHFGRVKKKLFPIFYKNHWNFTTTQKNVTLYYYVNICFKNIFQNMSCSKNIPKNQSPYNVKKTHVTLFNECFWIFYPH
jgi:hypothetical protein